MLKEMNILHISDTHGYHYKIPIEVFKDINLVIHSGDCSNYRDPYRNSNEVLDFIEWYKTVPVKHKVYVAGNRDTSIEKGLITELDFKNAGIVYLENEGIEIDSIKIWGSPYTPTFGEWAFMKHRSKTYQIWKQIPDDTDILITHCPPKGVLDLAWDYTDGIAKSYGDGALLKRINEINPKIVCFGHMHDDLEINNSGMKKLGTTIYSNGVCVRNYSGNCVFTNKANYITI